MQHNDLRLVARRQAHRTGLAAAVEHAARQHALPHLLSSVPQRHDLGVGGGVEQLDDPVRPAADFLPVQNDNGSERTVPRTCSAERDRSMALSRNPLSASLSINLARSGGWRDGRVKINLTAQGALPGSRPVGRVLCVGPPDLGGYDRNAA